MLRASDKCPFTGTLAISIPIAIGLLALGIVSGCERKGNRPDKTARQFDQIRDSVCRGEYKAALPRFEAFLEAHPDHKDASRAGLFLGKCHLALGDLDAADEAFESTVRDYGDTLEGHKCRYKLAVTALVRGDKRAALERFSALSAQPDGPLAAEATAMVRFLKAGAGPAEAGAD